MGWCTDYLSDDQETQELHSAVKEELVKNVCMWTRRVLVCGAEISALLLYLGGGNYTIPFLVGLIAASTNLLIQNIQVQASVHLSFLVLAIVVQALTQGCSASVLPALFGFIPCTFAVLCQTKRAVILSTTGVLLALFVIFAVDISGNCPTQPKSDYDAFFIVAERFIPLLVSILGNAVSLTASFQLSQKSLLLHAKASRSAANLTTLRRDVLHQVTHELRTPLNGLVGSVELLTTSETMNDNDMENALTLKSCLENIVKICDDVLMAAKFDQTDKSSAAHSTERRQTTVFRLSSCVDDVADNFAATAAAKNIKLKVDFVGNTMTMVRGMEGKLRQVLLNLVGNSIKFTDSGSITIRIQEEIASSPDTLRCKFEVQDTGIGFDAGKADLLFEAFHQGEQGGAVSRCHKGTGLGLTICRDIVELMGGKIAVSSTPGQGSSFYFTLDLEKEVSQSSLNTVVARDQTDIRNPFRDETDTRDFTAKDIPCRIVIADSDKESLASCQSVVKSVTPLAATSVVPSPQALLDLITSEKGVSATSRMPRVAFVECNSKDTEYLASIFPIIRQYGWLIVAYSEYGDFSHLTVSLRGTYAFFRRPLPLVRMGDMLLDAIHEVLQCPIVQSMAVIDKENALSAPTIKEDESFEGGKFKPDMNDSAFREPQAGVVLSIGKRAIPIECEASCNIRIQKEHHTIDGQTKWNGVLKGIKRKAGTITPNHRGRRKKQCVGNVNLQQGCKVVVADDTPVNVKVITKLIAQLTPVPVLTCCTGQSAINLVASSNQEEFLLLFMDWHMPIECGLSATESIRRIVKERGGPRTYICMITADTEGLHAEMHRRNICCSWEISEGNVVKVRENFHVSASMIDNETTFKKSSESTKQPLGYTSVDIVAEKPVNIRKIKAILSWFQEQIEQNPGSVTCFADVLKIDQLSARIDGTNCKERDPRH